jgi:hypothetical protein
MLGYWYPVTTASAPDPEPHSLAGLARVGLRLDGTPGFRAPHVWLTRHKRRRSTLDLFGDRFVVLAGPAGRAWCRVFEKAAAERNLPLDTYWTTPPGAGGDLNYDDDAWFKAYRLGDDGVALIRPDGFVAWHCEGMPRAPGILAETALDAVLCRSTVGARG